MSGKSSLGNNSHNNKTINMGDRNHFSEYFDEIVESLKVHATVMGPDHVQRIKEKLEKNPQLLADFRTTARPTAGRARTRGNAPADSEVDIHALTQEIIDKLVAPVLDDLETDAKRMSQDIYDNVLRLEEQTSAIGSGLKTKIALQRMKAKKVFQESVEFVCGTMTKVKINRGRIAKLNEEINAIYYNKSDQDEDELSDISVDDMTKIKSQQEIRQQLKDENNELQNSLFNHFDDTLGGLRALSKYDKKSLDLPNNLEKGKVLSRDIIDSMKMYMAHRATEYYAILPYLNYTMSSFDPKDGMYVEPPGKETGYKDVPECLRKEYEKQSETLYREILRQIKQKEMAKITAVFKCGLNKDHNAKCAVEDGNMAIYCLLAKYGKNDAHSITDLENHFVNSPGHFRQGSPINKIGKLRPFLEEILAMGIPLKSSQVMDPVIDILSERHPKFAVCLSKYEGGGETPNDCAALLDQMYSDIESACEGIERASGHGVWQAQNTAYVSSLVRNNKGKGKGKSSGKGKGKGKGKQQNKGKGKQRFKRPFHAMMATDDEHWQENRAYNTFKKGKGKKGSGKGKGKGKSYDNNKTCTAQGCNQASGKFKFCLECFKKGMDSGSITCKDGYKQRMLRAKQVEKFGFSSRQMEALSAMGQNLMSNRTDTQLEGENLFRVDARDTINANMAGNHNEKRMREFMDSLGVNQ